MEVVLDLVSGERLDQQSGAVSGQRLLDAARRSDRVTHVVQAVERHHPGRSRCRGRFALKAIGLGIPGGAEGIRTPDPRTARARPDGDWPVRRWSVSTRGYLGCHLCMVTSKVR